ncbi:MAG: aminoacyl-tRNA hydrolase [Anaerolineae bacterium]|nr:aminoacyl-tRNA hydrolase [Anaerolineae bacterium]
MSGKYLIVGLGNPGREYEKTRHNVGFMVIDALSARAGAGGEKKGRKASVQDATLAGKSVLLAKPLTYMNLSGEAVRALLDFYKIPLERFIVVHDDLDLPPGTLRLRRDGSAGGQNGIRSIIQQVGTQNFARVRFGIGRPPGRQPARDYVLQPFSGDEAILAQEVIATAAAALETWLTAGMEAAMTRYNGDATARAPEPDPAAELAVAQRAHELAPNDPAPLEQLIRLHKKARRLEEAAALHHKLAALYERRGETARLLKELENLAGLQPDNAPLQERLARLHEQQGNPRAAISRWLKLADVHQAAGNRPAARRAVEEACRINPQHPTALARLATLHDEQP